MKRHTTIGLAITAVMLIGASGCAGVPSERGAYKERSGALGSHIKTAQTDRCGNPRTAQPVVRICQKDLSKTGSRDLEHAIYLRVPSLGWRMSGQ